MTPEDESYLSTHIDSIEQAFGAALHLAIRTSHNEAVCRFKARPPEIRVRFA